MIASILGALGLSRTAAVVGEVLMIAAVAAIITGYVMHLRYKAQAYDVLSSGHAAIANLYGCPARTNDAERELGACLIARDRDAAEARANKESELRRQAAEAQAKLEAANAQLEAANKDLSGFIDASAADGGDGPVAPVLRDLYARQRKERGAAP